MKRTAMTGKLITKIVETSFIFTFLVGGKEFFFFFFVGVYSI